MSFVRCLRGIQSGQEYPADAIMNLDPIDGRPVRIELDLERLRRERPGLSWMMPDRRDLWRHGALLPLDAADPVDRPSIVSLGEGCTPMLDYSDHPLAKSVGIELAIKEEGEAYEGFGANPTQSFKDRGMTVVASMAKKLGLTKLAVPTQGNAGDSLCEYGRAAGMDVAIVMPDDTPLPILGKVAGCEKLDPYVSLDVVAGTIREAGQIIKEKYLPRGYFSVATFQEPGWRIEGKKTMGLELADPTLQAKPGPLDSRWELPDVVLYPTGGGTGVLGMWKAFDELQALGMIDDRRPRIVCVQSTSTTPVVTAFQQRAADTTVQPAGRTAAFGLNVPGGVGHFEVMRILYASDGYALAIDEPSMLTELRRVFLHKGWRLSPEGAAVLAALPELVDCKVIKPGDRVVAFNTGSADKYLPNIRHCFLRR